MKRLFVLLLAVCNGLIASGGQEEAPLQHVARERSFHVLHYRLEISVDLHARTCRGSVGITLAPLRQDFKEVMLDAADMTILGAEIANRRLAFSRSGDTLRIPLGRTYGVADTIRLRVSYSVTSPKKGLYFVSPDSGYPGKQWQAWSQGEAEDNHYWFPCYDFPNDMSTSEMIVTVADSLTAISNGALAGVSRDPAAHTATYHWIESKPHVSYLISLVVGRYVEVKDSWGTVPLSYYVYDYQKADAMRSFGKTPKMIEFYSAKIGYPYPWEKYAQTVVQDFIYGGEENVSATTLTDATIHNARAHLDYTSDGLVAHELAHMWWGDLLTCRDWSQAWLNEGFATYFENQFTSYDLGKDDAARELLENQITLRNVDVGDRRRPMVCNRYIQPMDLFDNRIYGKGAVVLNMLHSVIGDDLFWKSINVYAHRYAYTTVTTDDFRACVEQVTGSDLRWFFNEWTAGAGYPEFDITSKWDPDNLSVTLTVRQVQAVDSLTGIFNMPVDIEVWVNGRPEPHRVTVSKPEETFTFHAYQQPQLVLFDKGSILLKKVRFAKSASEWVFQLGRATDGVDRLEAIDALGGLADSSVVFEALGRAAIEDRFWAVRQDAVWALGDARTRDASGLLLEAYGDRDARVRTAAVTSLARYHGERVLQTLHHAFDSDSSYEVEAAALRALARADSVRRKSYLAEGLTRDSRNEVVRGTALQILSGIHDDDALATIMAHTRYGVDPSLRIASVGFLASGWSTREDVVAYIIGMLHDPSFHVKRAVISVLGRMGNASAIAPLERLAATDPDSRLEKDAREAIDRIQQSLQQHH